MRIKLNRKFERRMVSQKESGMGYQKVNVRLKDGRVIGGYVYDSATLDIDEQIRLEDISDIEVID